MREPTMADYVKHGLTPLRFPDGSVVWVAPPAYYEPAIRGRAERKSRARPTTQASPGFQLSPKKEEAAP